MFWISLTSATYIGFFFDPEGATYRCAISGNSRDIKKCISFPKVYYPSLWFSNIYWIQELREQLPKISELLSKVSIQYPFLLCYSLLLKFVRREILILIRGSIFQLFSTKNTMPTQWYTYLINHLLFCFFLLAFSLIYIFLFVFYFFIW